MREIGERQTACEACPTTKANVGACFACLPPVKTNQHDHFISEI
jgi:hypothetical protein